MAASDSWLSAGPRGRRMCWSLLRGQLTGPAWWRARSDGAHDDPGFAGELAAELTEALRTTTTARLLDDDSERVLMTGLDEAVSSAMYWQPPDPVDQVLSEPRFAALLDPFISAVAAASPGWWGEPLDIRTLRAVEYGEPFHTPAPELTGTADRLAEWRAAVLEEEQRFTGYSSDVSGSWWSTPALHNLPTTTRALPELGALALAFIEDGFGWKSACCHPVAPLAPPRVYEIHSGADWVELVNRYPLRITESRRNVWEMTTGARGDWVIPDYLAVSGDFDAVHLSTRGYLAAAGLAHRVGDALTVLAGWAPDKTYWLTDCLVRSGEPRWWALAEQGDPFDWIPAADPLTEGPSAGPGF